MTKKPSKEIISSVENKYTGIPESLEEAKDLFFNQNKIMKPDHLNDEEQKLIKAYWLFCKARQRDNMSGLFHIDEDGNTSKVWGQAWLREAATQSYFDALIKGTAIKEVKWTSTK